MKQKPAGHLLSVDLQTSISNLFTPLYNFFHKKISYRDFLMYNKFATKNQKGVTLYDKLIIQQKFTDW